MNRLSPKIWMWIFGFGAIGALAIFLMLYEGSPGPLASPHGEVIRGSTLLSCKQCHADGGLTVGCLKCHVEIAAQLDTDSGYHTYLLKDKPPACEQCHLDHLGADFPLVSALAWKDQPTNAFTHPHVEFNLTGVHSTLACEACHEKKRAAPFALPDFPGHPRPSTMLGLEQDCIGCHEDIHLSGELTRDCLRCHDQDAFKPAPRFKHDRYFVLEGVHATTACSACHQTEEARLSVNPDAMIFGPVKGKGCADCHETPHRTSVGSDCLSCHSGTDEAWSNGRRGILAPDHARFGFSLEGPHAKVECAECHAPGLPYGERYPDPAAPAYTRQPDQCRGCHADPHGGQFIGNYSGCLACHRSDRFSPSIIGPAQHSTSYPLRGAHQAVACNQCHTIDPQSEVRQFAHTATACKACHADPHGTQFLEQLRDGDCTACHLDDSSTFRIPSYKHQGAAAFFLGKAHRQAECRQCHVGADDGGPVIYQSAPTDCAACHADVHRGQFRQNGTTDCARCHDATEQWSAGAFAHDRDADFSLEAAHAKVACVACHRPVPQPDGKTVVQYKPLTSRCEDCHGFTSK